MQLHFRKATSVDCEAIWEILKQAIERRKLEGSSQWQDGYPNPASIQKDLDNDWGYVITAADAIVGYGALIFNNEPAYAAIKGGWLSDKDFLVLHRIAVSEKALRQGVAIRIFKEAEKLAKANNVFSIKVDTNYDNTAMLHLLQKLEYIYCGEVMMRDNPRMAFEKLLK